MTVLIAGFAPFPGAPYNPSGDLIATLAEEAGTAKTADAAAFSAVLLPVGWDKAWPMLREAISRVRAHSVVLFGLHMRAERLRIELFARNRRELGREDAFGGFPAGPSVMEGPERVPARLPFGEVAGLLRQIGLDFEWSTDAGGYLCNDTLYRLALNADALGVARYGFVHVPMSDGRIDDLLATGCDLPPVFNTIDGAALHAFARALIGCLAEAEGTPGQSEGVGV